MKRITFNAEIYTFISSNNIQVSASDFDCLGEYDA